MLILSILLVVLTFSFLVIIHELGHFIAARRAGVKVEEFGIGFPPRLYAIKGKKTTYTINLLPFGGFVRLRGEVGGDKARDSFASQSFWTKTKILLAGVMINIGVAYLLVTFLCVVGLPPVYFETAPSFGPIQPISSDQSSLTVVQVAPGSAAEKAGIISSDTLLNINGQALSSNDQLRQYTKTHKGETVELAIRRGGQDKTLTVTLGESETQGVLGVAAFPMQPARYVWWQAPIAALGIMYKLVIMTVGAFGGLIVSLFTKAKVSEGVTGPIGITMIFEQVMRFGWQYVLALIASISLSLGVINALPIPALDGGRWLIIALNRYNIKISDSTENIIHLVGFVALIGLMIFVAISDISHLGR